MNSSSCKDNVLSNRIETLETSVAGAQTSHHKCVVMRERNQAEIALQRAAKRISAFVLISRECLAYSNRA
jgi:hypothetical protein